MREALIQSKQSLLSMILVSGLMLTPVVGVQSVLAEEDQTISDTTMVDSDGVEDDTVTEMSEVDTTVDDADVLETRIELVDAQTGEPVSDIHVEIYLQPEEGSEDEPELVATFISDQEGVVSFDTEGELLPGRFYTVILKQPDHEERLEIQEVTTDQPVMVDEVALIPNEIMTLHLTGEFSSIPHPEDLEEEVAKESESESESSVEDSSDEESSEAAYAQFVLIDHTTGEPIPGAKVELIQDGEMGQTLETDTEGVVRFEGLTLGETYRMRITEVPAGYQLELLEDGTWAQHDVALNVTETVPVLPVEDSHEETGDSGEAGNSGDVPAVEHRLTLDQLYEDLPVISGYTTPESQVRVTIQPSAPNAEAMHYQGVADEHGIYYIEVNPHIQVGDTVIVSSEAPHGEVLKTQATLKGVSIASSVEESQARDDKRLPETGETSGWIFVALGVVAVIAGGLLLWPRIKKNK